MNDRDVMSGIQALVDEEHRLLRTAEDERGLSEGERARLEDVQVRLDQCWDLLRQRRARREFHTDPGEAHVRDASVVERYQQ